MELRKKCYRGYIVPACLLERLANYLVEQGCTVVGYSVIGSGEHAPDKPVVSPGEAKKHTEPLMHLLVSKPLPVSDDPYSEASWPKAVERELWTR